MYVAYNLYSYIFQKVIWNRLGGKICYEYKYEPRYIRSFCWIVVIVYKVIELLFAENKGDDCGRGLARLGG